MGACMGRTKQEQVQDHLLFQAWSTFRGCMFVSSAGMMLEFPLLKFSKGIENKLILCSYNCFLHRRGFLM